MLVFEVGCHQSPYSLRCSLAWCTHGRPARSSLSFHSTQSSLQFLLPRPTWLNLRLGHSFMCQPLSLLCASSRLPAASVNSLILNIKSSGKPYLFSPSSHFELYPVHHACRTSRILLRFLRKTFMLFWIFWLSLSLAFVPYWSITCTNHIPIVLPLYLLL